MRGSLPHRLLDNGALRHRNRVEGLHLHNPVGVLHHLRRSQGALHRLHHNPVAFIRRSRERAFILRLPVGLLLPEQEGLLHRLPNKMEV